MSVDMHAVHPWHITVSWECLFVRVPMFGVVCSDPQGRCKLDTCVWLIAMSVDMHAVDPWPITVS